ncbi:hypothetical protein IF125_13640 [Empedobacter stercoris]|uniref:hypothetical protein n=1 Tax=Empedobacter stercoris TaxID=1628248 RepID=UPI001CE1FD98|nr:hypothetical protein [Empedobacter stercoris]MCA4783281.1 hypothetical protein [Empedobacter stercoris]
MVLEKDKIKEEIVFHLTAYSKYYCRLYLQCEDMFEERKGHFALFNLFALLENITKTVLNDFDDTNYNLNVKLKEIGLINELEYEFLNNNKTGIRKIRNILAHANLSQYDLKLQDQKVTYPFTENETCLILYRDLSLIISGIILKLLKTSLVMKYEINNDQLLKKLDFTIITRTIEELMEFKGMKSNSVWETYDDSTKYRLLENMLDVNLLATILKNMNSKHSK